MCKKMMSDILATCRHSNCEQIRQDLAEARHRVCATDAELRQVYFHRHGAYHLVSLMRIATMRSAASILA